MITQYAELTKSDIRKSSVSNIDEIQSLSHSNMNKFNSRNTVREYFMKSADVDDNNQELKKKLLDEN